MSCFMNCDLLWNIILCIYTCIRTCIIKYLWYIIARCPWIGTMAQYLLMGYQCVTWLPKNKIGRYLKKHIYSIRIHQREWKNSTLKIVLWITHWLQTSLFSNIKQSNGRQVWQTCGIKWHKHEIHDIHMIINFIIGSSEDKRIKLFYKL